MLNRYIMELLSKVPENMDLTKLQASLTMDYAEMQKRLVDEKNNEIGDLPFFNCDICHNKGVIFYLDDELYEHARECECMKKRAIFERLNESGLGDVVKNQTFSTFIDEKDFQKVMKETAIKYVQSNSSNWFYIGGQTGCGKTHICTAIAVNLVSKGKIVKYEMWRQLFHYLQSNQFNFERYDAKIKEIQNADVLYIDDFLKSFGTENPNEMNFAFEVIQSRYTSNKPTIISSELSIKALKKLDGAIAGRIIQKSGEFIVEITDADDKNYRLK